MLPGDLLMVLQSQDFTQLLELGNLTILQQTHGNYGNNVVGKLDLLLLSPKKVRLEDYRWEPPIPVSSSCLIVLSLYPLRFYY
jgi:hypothetical protein